VGAEVALAFGRDHDLPNGEPGCLLGEREDQAAVAGARLEADPRVADFTCADQFVERNLVGVGER
jgi:hypothetical protein